MTEYRLSIGQNLQPRTVQNNPDDIRLKFLKYDVFVSLSLQAEVH